MVSFEDLGINEAILRSIKEQNYVEPTFIQEKSIPPILEGKDVIGQSATGSGKTLAFACGIIHSMEKGRGVGALVLTPTRELAEQVSDALKGFSKHKFFKIAAIYGGVSINPQVSLLRIADVVVATPGRLLDHMQRGTINLSKVKIVVLDEADRMVDMGFIDDVNKIVSQCPRNRQTLLFSATMSPDIEKIKNRYMNNPVSIFTRQQVDPLKLSQEYYDVQKELKFSLLVHLLNGEHSGSVIVFCNTRRQVDFLAKNLIKNNLDATAIHGGFSQAKRSNNMGRFQSKRINILVCTDVAARGLDIKDVSHIYNYDIPKESKEYIHRIGRTARAGKEGRVVNLLSDVDHPNFAAIFKAYPSINIREMELPQIKRVQISVSPASRRDGNFRKRGFQKNRSSSNRGAFYQKRRGSR
ncbi:MAG: DEAD/DEAH box helicase [Nanoarchaeota archaeon]|nr:DEAD/DEAH box helicase [Nanoarchaeota archaeon]MBU1855075.1 DEAD/DEAH box helicase [Nanoarchaeota archaeon]